MKLSSTNSVSERYEFSLNSASPYTKSGSQTTAKTYSASAGITVPNKLSRRLGITKVEVFADTEDQAFDLCIYDTKQDDGTQRIYQISIEDLRDLLNREGYVSIWGRKIEIFTETENFG